MNVFRGAIPLCYETPTQIFNYGQPFIQSNDHVWSLDTTNIDEQMEPPLPLVPEVYCPEVEMLEVTTLVYCPADNPVNLVPVIYCPEYEMQEAGPLCTAAELPATVPHLSIIVRPVLPESLTNNDEGSEGDGYGSLVDNCPDGLQILTQRSACPPAETSSLRREHIRISAQGVEKSSVEVPNANPGRIPFPTSSPLMLTTESISVPSTQTKAGATSSVRPATKTASIYDSVMFTVDDLWDKLISTVKTSLPTLLQCFGNEEAQGRLNTALGLPISMKVLSLAVDVALRGPGKYASYKI